MAGYSKKSLVTKLGIKPGYRVCFINAPPDYNRTLGPGTLGVNLNYGWQDDVGTSVTDNGNFVVDSYGLLGAAVSWSELSLASVPGDFRALIWGRNLLDKDYGLSGQTALEPLGADRTQIYGEPRTYGVTLTYLY